MIKIDLVLDALALNLFRAELDCLHQGLLQEHSPHWRTPEDEDETLTGIWCDHLREQLQADLEPLMQVFAQPQMGQGVMALRDDMVEPILRSLSAARLYLRRTRLSRLPDEQMESGSMDWSSLEEPEQRAALTYIFLAGLQEAILMHSEGDLAE